MQADWSDWGPLALALAVFVGSHGLAVRPPVKPRLVAALGARGFTLAYSALSLVLLGWAIVEAGRAPHLPLWPLDPWHRWTAAALMLAASVLVAQALAGVNPFSFGSRAAPFDPDRPGIAGLSRHPLPLALALWALAHGLANGDVAHLVLFVPMGGFALLGMAMIDRRKRRQMPDWPHLTRNAPLLGWPLGGLPLAPTLVGMAVWAALFVLHPLVFGVTPL